MHFGKEEEREGGEGEIFPQSGQYGPVDLIT